MDFDEHYSGLFRSAFAQMAQQIDPEQLEQLNEKLPSIIDETVPKMIEIAVDGLVESLHKGTPQMLAEYRGIRHGFEERLEARWGKAFDLAQMVMVCARELGEEFSHKHSAGAAEENDLVFPVLVRLHARACRVSEEVLALLRAGFGQAAMARWRALHEVAVVASFIKDHGQETAERYLAHEGIEAWRGMREYQQYAERLGEQPFTAHDVQESQQHHDELRAKYGARFEDQYGWANHALAATDPSFAKKKVGFPAIEKAANLDHLRPYYRMASHSVHANPKGITFNPDLLDDQILLAGASNAGLAEPGHSTLISLVQVTVSLLLSRSGEAAPVVLAALLRLSDEAGQAYGDAHNQLIAESPA